MPIVPPTTAAHPNTASAMRMRRRLLSRRTAERRSLIRGSIVGVGGETTGAVGWSTAGPERRPDEAVTPATIPLRNLGDGDPPAVAQAHPRSEAYVELSWTFRVSS